MILFCALCIQIQKILFVHKSWGASLVSLEHSFAHIIIYFIHLAHRIIGLVGSIDIRWLLASIGMIACVSLCYVFVSYHSLAIFVPQYSLYSSKYLPLDMCMAFHYLVEKYTIYGGTQFILAFYAFLPFWKSMPMGEKFQRVLWRSLESYLLLLWFCSVAFASHTHALLVVALHSEASHTHALLVVALHSEA